MRYFDASALAKRYVREVGSARVNVLLASSIPVTSRLSAVEIVSAVARRMREGVLSDGEGRRVLTALEGDLQAMLLVEATPEVVARAQQLLMRHPLRAGDAIQLASCLELRDQLTEEVEFVAFDDRLMAAARLEGLR